MSQPVVANPIWAEVLQLVPVIVLAFPVVTTGQVDLTSMGQAFPLAAALVLPVTVAVRWRGAVLNPILLGTALWLILGAVGFGLEVPVLRDLWTRWQGFALFLSVLPTLLVAMATPWGAIGALGPKPWVRGRSAVLVGCACIAVAWSWGFQHDVRLGGGLPFIALNIVRRVLIAHGVRAMKDTHTLDE